jgi:hypothetical protein
MEGEMWDIKEQGGKKVPASVEKLHQVPEERALLGEARMNPKRHEGLLH